MAKKIPTRLRDPVMFDWLQVQSCEDKCNHLGKLKHRLEKQLDEVEDSWEREKKSRGDIEKLKRQASTYNMLTLLSQDVHKICDIIVTKWS